jgi:hypothetical protein
MGLISASRQVLKGHVHTAEDRCPLCEQPIALELARKIESKRREQYQLALQQAQAEAGAAAEHKVQAARAEAKAVAEAAMLARLAEFERKLAEAEQARAGAQARMAALEAEQQAAVAQRVREAQEALQKERDAAVLAEKTKAFEEAQRLQAKLQDLQRQLDRKTAHELGETSEIDLYEQLKAAFEGDRIRRVGKGVNGADVIHEVVHNGRVCGKIVYDAKNRNAWQNEFVNKLRADKIAEAADHAILSSNKFPKDKAQVHFQDGVIIAQPARVVALAEILRGQIVRMHELRASDDEREHKTAQLYAFITSEHCRNLIAQVETQAGRMAELDVKEQEAHRRTWDARSKLIQSVQKARSDLTFEIERIIGTAGNGPAEDAA